MKEAYYLPWIADDIVKCPHADFEPFTRSFTRQNTVWPVLQFLVKENFLF